ncbi:MAG: hypothetical protein U0401_18230 [Anaerolineae bacterium]
MIKPVQWKMRLEPLSGRGAGDYATSLRILDAAGLLLRSISAAAGSGP